MTAIGLAERFQREAQLKGRIWLRWFAVISMGYSFWTIFPMDEYMPWQVRFARATELTLIGHFGLWLATFEWRGWTRFIVAAIFLPTLLGIAVLWWNIGIIVLGWLGWRFLQLIRGGPHDAQSI